MDKDWLYNWLATNPGRPLEEATDDYQCTDYPLRVALDELIAEGRLVLTLRP